MKGEAEPGAEPRNREPEKNEGEAGGGGAGRAGGGGAAPRLRCLSTEMGPGAGPLFARSYPKISFGARFSPVLF